MEVDNGTLTFGNFSQTAGSTDLNGGNLAFSSPAQILGGDVVGSGIINGSIVNSGGLLSPGHSAGMITINGNYTQDPDGMLLMEIAGLGSGQFDVLNVTGIAYLDGLLEISLLNGFSPTLGDTFDILNFGSYSGQFAMVQGLDLGCGKYFELDYSANGLRLTSVPEPSSLYLAVIGSLWLIRRKWRTVGQ
ncbi:MAG: PEP-CTERM sorting domain-containing protein [Phycisphaerae bacterium]|nr:PEP-CTERM sorting domain-containing protein [Phycisphaerae bacterium]